MKRIWMLIVVNILLGSASYSQAKPLDELLSQYQAQSATPFNHNTGKALWTKTHIDVKSGEKRSCSTCHTDDLRAKGKHATTNKVIDPLAPSANSERLTDIKKIEKWLTRNCKWTIGRECTPQEKGDYLTYINAN